MSSANIYLDESGDLGWTLDKPYRTGGSSRFLTIAAIVVPPEKCQYPKRVVRDLYKYYGWSPSVEKKWVDMSDDARLKFATDLAKLPKAHPDLLLYSIVVKKENVQLHIRQDANKLYNYMVRHALLDEMAKHQVVNFIPDARSVKVESGKSMHDYLQTELWFTKVAGTVLNTNPVESSQSLGVQCADMLAGVIQSHYEFRKSKPWGQMSGALRVKSLFF